MSRNFISKIIFAISFVVAAVLWILSLTIESFEWFNLSWAAVIVAGVGGILLVLTGVFGTPPTQLKRIYIIAGAILIILTFIIITTLYAFEDHLITPIIVLIATIAILISIIAVGGKNWDQGDNKKIGYKDYRQRKAEEEKEKEKNIKKK